MVVVLKGVVLFERELSTANVEEEGGVGEDLGQIHREGNSKKALGG